jgi:hypothetical protein
MNGVGDFYWTLGQYKDRTSVNIWLKRERRAWWRRGLHREYRWIDSIWLDRAGCGPAEAARNWVEYRVRRQREREEQARWLAANQMPKPVKTDAIDRAMRALDEETT